MRRLLLPISLLATLCLVAQASSLTVVIGDPVIDTAITEGPPDGATIEDESPAFSFTATRDGQPFPGAVFRCSVDGAPPRPCTSPAEAAVLGDGAHSFDVYAEDPETFTKDPQPAHRGFVVDGGVLGCGEEAAGPDEDEAEPEEAKEEDCEAEDAASPYPPEECALRTARARVFAYTAHEKVRLVVRYTSFAPADVTVEYRLSGSKGPLKLGRATERFAKRGLFRLTEHPDQAEMARVRAAKRFTVEIEIPGTPSYCRRYAFRHLTIHHTVHGQAVWFQSDSIFGEGS